MLKNTSEKFGLIAKTFHWVLAILILWLLSVGFAMVSIPPSPDKFWVYGLHKSFGILILILVCGRLTWRLISPRPAPLPTHKAWEVKLSEAIHAFLYFCMFAMPLSGWLMSSAGGFPAEFFGLFSLPQVLPKSEGLFDFFRGVHGYTAWGLLAALALHFAGAAKHHFIDKDDTLRRMTSMRVKFYWGALIFAVGGFLWTADVGLGVFGVDRDEGSSVRVEDGNSGPGKAEERVEKMQAKDSWKIDKDASFIKFEASQSGEPIVGAFEKFDGTIVFDPAKIEDAYVEIEIDISSIETGSDERDDQAESAEWFDEKTYPRATFIADSFDHIQGNQYVAHGALTIRGKAAVVDLPFTLDIRESPEGQAALMEGMTTLKRTDFGIGWADTSTIGDEVKILITVLATIE